jgi:hypothetical protein
MIMKFIDKYRELIDSPDIKKYIGESRKRHFLVHVITGFVVLVLGLAAILLISAIARVLINYL